MLHTPSSLRMATACVEDVLVDAPGTCQQTPRKRALAFKVGPHMLKSLLCRCSCMQVSAAHKGLSPSAGLVPDNAHGEATLLIIAQRMQKCRQM